jgi:hypothetical protein
MPRRPSTAIDRSLRAFAHHQLGIVTARQATEAGIRHNQLSTRRLSGQLIQEFRGVYAFSTSPATVERRILAGALAVPSSVIGGLSAGRLLELPGLGPDAAAPVTLWVESCRPICVPGIAIRQSGVDWPVEPWFNVQRMSAAATIVTLAGSLPPAKLERCLDALIIQRLSTAQEIVTLVNSVPSASISGRKVLVDLLAARSDGRIGQRSRKEQDVFRWLREAGLPDFATNHKVRTPDGVFEVDAAWAPWHVALEVSPFITHGSREAQQRDGRKRQALTRANWHLVEAFDSDLASPEALRPTIELLRQLIR